MSSDGPGTLVVVDTDVFGTLFVRPRSDEHDGLRTRLLGLVPVLATQTAAELAAWPRLADWGPHRTARFEAILAGVAVVPVTDAVTAAYVDLVVEGRRSGHALADDKHTADRWVAATALALDRPLVTRDPVFTGAPGLTLL